MTEARNVYPRLCWGCLGEIRGYVNDYALLDCGGICLDCHIKRVAGKFDEMPGLRETLRGQSELMNDVAERDNLLRRVEQLQAINKIARLSQDLGVYE
jgi:hypothetical protein